MTFTLLSPWYLVGLLAAGIPLLIHLSRSRRMKKMRFSTTRFFTEQFMRSYRMSQLRELLLLAFRMALFALLAMALTRPLLAPEGGAAFSGSGPRTVLIVLDDSASMTLMEGDRTLLGRAQDAAVGLIDTLAAGDQVSVVLAGRRAGGVEVLFPEPTDDLDDARRRVRDVKPAALGTDLSGALTAAEQLAIGARVAGRAAAVYVLSDLQESGFDLPDGATVRSDVADLPYFFVSIRPKDAGNRAVTAVRYAATRPRVGVPFALRPLVALGADDGKDVTARLYVDEAKVGEQKIDRLPGNRWGTPRFYHTFAAPGWHAGHVEIEDGRLTADDRRYFAVEVPAATASVNVLAVNGAPSSVAAQDELFFLRFALTAAPDGQPPPFKITATSPQELASQPLDTFPLVILANVERLSDDAVEKLEQYADGGGMVFVFLGDKVNAGWYNDRLAAASGRNGGLLPAKLEGRVADVGFIGAVNYEHRALAAFQEPRLGSLLGPSLTFKAMLASAPPAQVLMKASSGAPLLCEKGFGKGKVVLFTSTADRDWSDFPVRPGFLLWSRFVAEYLTQAPLSLQAGHATGDAVRLTAPPGESGSLWVRRPDGKAVVAPRASDGGGFEFTDTATPGVYAVLRSDQETRVGLFAVNLDTYESDLTYLDDPLPDEGQVERKKRVEGDLKERLGGAPLVSYLTDPAQAAATLGGSARTFKLWEVLLIVVLIVGLVEPWLANQISGKLYAKQPTPRLEEVGR